MAQNAQQLRNKVSAIRAEIKGYKTLDERAEDLKPAPKYDNIVHEKPQMTYDEYFSMQEKKKIEKNNDNDCTPSTCVMQKKTNHDLEDIGAEYSVKKRRS